ncbi:hypothetical protein [Roseateles aquatilis]|jgi:hypothetical protein|uniref:hypothetical protein n=1 Tax=Roseateles aquatilis TaxID=431061 RepID=UPI001EDED1F5|nr:hypothetical protein [Roseateles aquatilis]
MGYLNPLLRLPAARALLALGAKERMALRTLLLELRSQANDEAERAWSRRKGPMACYWRAVATYARHLAHVLRQPGTVPGVDAEVQRLTRDLAVARRQVALLVEAASSVLPLQARPQVSTPEGWAQQLRLASVECPSAAEVPA